MPSSTRSGVITLLHTACGAGILAMPFAFKPFGLFFGLLMILLCGVCAMFGLLLQARVLKYVPNGQQASFFVLSQMINANLSVIFDIAIAVKCFGVGVSYMIVVGDLLPQICHVFTENHILLNRDFHITIVMLFIVSPLCFMKKLNSLRYASMIAISAVVYLCILVIVHFITPNDDIKDLKGNISWGFPENEPSPLTTIPIFIFAYTCHHNMFSVINEQINPSFHNIKYIAIFTVSLAFLLYIVIGGAGYLTFGDNIVGNIITLYPKTISSTIGRIAIVFLVMLAFPLQCHPARASIHHIIHYIETKRFLAKQTNNENYDNQDTAMVNMNENVPTEDDTLLADELIEEDSMKQPQIIPLTGKRFNIITALLLITSYLLAISVHSLAFILSLVGATGSTSISFILPGIFGYKLIGTEYESANDLPLGTKLFKNFALCLTIWGVLVMFTSLCATLLVGAGH